MNADFSIAGLVLILRQTQIVLRDDLEDDLGVAHCNVLLNRRVMVLLVDVATYTHIV